MTDYVVNASSGKVLDDPDFSTSNGTQIQQYQLDLGSNQQWVFIPLANGKDLIVNASSGKVLDDPNSSNSNGTTVIQYQLNGGTNQQWNLVAQMDGNWEAEECVQRQGACRPQLVHQQRDRHPAIPAQRRHQPAMEHQPVRQPGGADSLLARPRRHTAL